jgi:hypothetical protein
MSLHFLNIRCEECEQLYSIRRPNETILIPAIVAASKCPTCHPEALKDCCVACRIPFSVCPHHGKGMCFTCYQRALRAGLQKPAAA